MLSLSDLSPFEVQRSYFLCRFAMSKRQCWECFRRRLVCDTSEPSCKKCTSAGKTCPGYGATEPLKWLAPSTNRCLTQRQKRKATGNRWCYTTTTEKTIENHKVPQEHSQVLRVNASLGELKPDDSAIVEAALYCMFPSR